MANVARSKFLHVVDIVLRVPPIFVMDCILNRTYPYEYTYRFKPFPTDILTSGSGSGSGQAANSMPLPLPGNLGELANNEDVDVVFISSMSFDLHTIVLFFIHITGFLIALVMFLLSQEYLLETYRWMLSLGAVLISYWGNSVYMSMPPGTDIPIEECLLRFFLYLALQLSLAAAFCMSRRLGMQVSFITSAIFFLPMVASVFNFTFVESLPSTFAMFNLGFLIVNLVLNMPAMWAVLESGVRRSRMIIRYYGLHTLLENEWSRLNVPHVLRVFWLTRLAEHVVMLVADKLESAPTIQGMVDPVFDNLSLWMKDALVRGCDTMTAVLGMTSIVASAAHYLGYAMQQFLLTEDEEEKSIGTVSAVLFLILALQTGLTGLEPEKRFIRLYRNFCLLLTAILHFIHNMVNPLLMSLSASHNRSVQRHTRALAVCGCLVAFPCWFLTYLWSRHALSTWLLAVSAFSIEVVIKVIISLLIYLLFMLDACRDTFWEQLDDYVYYIRATGNTVEFLFGIFLFFNGAWILLFESGGAIRACMMCIHAYFNIWLQAKAGWRTFMKRRTAVNKINALPEATEEQLRQFDDVCAICYQELTNARITKCNHYFHGVCLRKWLYVQDRCPLCHDTLYKVDSEVDIEEFEPAMNNLDENDAEMNELDLNGLGLDEAPIIQTPETTDTESVTEFDEAWLTDQWAAPSPGRSDMTVGSYSEVQEVLPDESIDSPGSSRVGNEINLIHRLNAATVSQRNLQEPT